MADPATPRTRVTRDIGAGSVSSGSPLAPPKASPCVLDRLDLARPHAHAAAEQTISAQPRPACSAPLKFVRAASENRVNELSSRRSLPRCALERPARL